MSFFGYDRGKDRMVELEYMKDEKNKRRVNYRPHGRAVLMVILISFAIVGISFLVLFSS